mmetsp:Transcript_13638/g.25045  ORF Transcript_13638/g.25045 Transcript_13638/m.25045 type:complete len:178 (+) Transcript_13638:45-578(+)
MKATSSLGSRFSVRAKFSRLRRSASCFAEELAHVRSRTPVRGTRRVQSDPAEINRQRSDSREPAKQRKSVAEAACDLGLTILCFHPSLALDVDGNRTPLMPRQGGLSQEELDSISVSEPDDKGDWSPTTTSTEDTVRARVANEPTPLDGGKQYRRSSMASEESWVAGGTKKRIIMRL